MTFGTSNIENEQNEIQTTKVHPKTRNNNTLLRKPDLVWTAGSYWNTNTTDVSIVFFSPGELFSHYVSKLINTDTVFQ